MLLSLHECRKEAGANRRGSGETWIDCQLSFVTVARASLRDGPRLRLDGQPFFFLLAKVAAAEWYAAEGKSFISPTRDLSQVLSVAENRTGSASVNCFANSQTSRIVSYHLPQTLRPLVAYSHQSTLAGQPGYLRCLNARLMRCYWNEIE